VRDLKKQERAAIEAVARRFSATWEQSRDTADAYRYIYSQLRVATHFKKVVMVFGDGRIGMLDAG
jgi:hypothetical protein